MAQKVLKVGSSAAVTIPAKDLKRAGINIGDQVEVSFDEVHRIFHLRPLEAVDTELISWARNFNKRYAKALKELADK